MPFYGRTEYVNTNAALYSGDESATVRTFSDVVYTPDGATNFYANSARTFTSLDAERYLSLHRQANALRWIWNAEYTDWNNDSTSNKLTATGLQTNSYAAAKTSSEDSTNWVTTSGTPPQMHVTVVVSNPSTNTEYQVTQVAVEEFPFVQLQWAWDADVAWFVKTGPIAGGTTNEYYNHSGITAGEWYYLGNGSSPQNYSDFEDTATPFGTTSLPTTVNSAYYPSISSTNNATYIKGWQATALRAVIAFDGGSTTMEYIWSGKDRW
jgi:hypothetical protein